MEPAIEAEVSSALELVDNLSVKSSDSGLSEDTCWAIFGGPCPAALRNAPAFDTKKENVDVEDQPVSDFEDMDSETPQETEEDSRVVPSDDAEEFLSCEPSKNLLEPETVMTKSPSLESKSVVPSAEKSPNASLETVENSEAAESPSQESLKPTQAPISSKLLQQNTNSGTRNKVLQNSADASWKKVENLEEATYGKEPSEESLKPTQTPSISNKMLQQNTNSATGSKDLQTSADALRKAENLPEATCAEKPPQKSLNPTQKPAGPMPKSSNFPTKSDTPPNTPPSEEKRAQESLKPTQTPSIPVQKTTNVATRSNTSSNTAITTLEKVETLKETASEEKPSQEPNQAPSRSSKQLREDSNSGTQRKILQNGAKAMEESATSEDAAAAEEVANSPGDLPVPGTKASIIEEPSIKGFISKGHTVPVEPSNQPSQPGKVELGKTNFHSINGDPEESLNVPDPRVLGFQDPHQTSRRPSSEVILKIESFDSSNAITHTKTQKPSSHRHQQTRRPTVSSISNISITKQMKTPAPPRAMSSSSDTTPLSKESLLPPQLTDSGSDSSATSCTCRCCVERQLKRKARKLCKCKEPKCLINIFEESPAEDVQMNYMKLQSFSGRPAHSNKRVQTSKAKLQEAELFAAKTSKPVSWKGKCKWDESSEESSDLWNRPQPDNLVRSLTKALVRRNKVKEVVSHFESHNQKCFNRKKQPAPSTQLKEGCRCCLRRSDGAEVPKYQRNCPW